MSNFSLADHEIEAVIENLKQYNKRVVIWGTGFLGMQVFHLLKNYSIEVTRFWDSNAMNNSMIDGIRVDNPFDDFDLNNSVIIVCVGNQNVREQLLMQLETRKKYQVLAEHDLKQLFRAAINNREKASSECSFTGLISDQQRIELAIKEAIKNNYSSWEQQHYSLEALRLCNNILICGDINFAHRIEFHLIQNNGIKGIKYIYDSNNKTDISCSFARVELQDMIRNDIDMVIVESYNDPIITFLEKNNLNYVYFGSLFLNVFEEKRDSEWFRNNAQMILKAYELFEDEESRRIYTEVLCNRIAPALALRTFEDMYTAGEYFEHGIFALSDSESLVDAGAYIGDSIARFISITNGVFDDIYAFELDENIFMELSRNVAKYATDKIHLYNKGVYCENSWVGCAGNGTGVHISEGDSKQAEVVRLDDILAGRKVTMIKMDIEGAEMAALIGAENIIKNNKPKLAISAYHKLSDLWEIPLYIKKINPEYRLALRHHSKLVWDTDCYAY